MRQLRTRTAVARALGLLGMAALAAVLTGCQADEEAMGVSYGPKHLRQVSPGTSAKMAELGMPASSPVLMRIFKAESKFEVWKQDRSGRYALLKSFDICKWSGKLGPKIKEGDRQAPEGYYTITPALMNPNSQYFLAFNTGFPNAYDRANGRTGTALMVHGACSSRGCYAMTDDQIQEIYALARDAFRGGQKGFQLQAYPFRMTAENMAKHWHDPSMAFWKMLKEGYDTFELTRREPKVDVCGRKYVFNSTSATPMSPAAACPELIQPQDLKVALAAKAKADEAKAIVLAARFDAERKAEDDRRIAIAANIEKERQKAEERRIALAAAGPNPSLGSLLGLGGSGKPQADIVPAGDETTEAAVTAAGEPLPRRDPRAPAALALAQNDAGSERSGSMFSRLFSFGSDDEVPPPAAVTATAEAAGAPATTAATSASVPPAAANAAGVETTASIKPAAAPKVAEPVAAPACAPAGIPAPAGVPACPAAAAPAPTPTQQASTGILDRIGNWF